MLAIFYILIVLFSVVIHEVSHGFMANLLGDPTAKMQGRLTLNPLKHLDPVGSIVLPALLYFSGAPVIGWAKPVPFNPYNLRAGKWGPAIVAIAGPISNLVVAGFFGILVRLNILFSLAPTVFNELCILVVSLNVILAVFNLVPIPPLDGSKVLFAALPYKFRHVETWLERYGLFLIIILLVWGVNFIIPIQQAIVRLLAGV
jgi:Zn-dependent protease